MDTGCECLTRFGAMVLAKIGQDGAGHLEIKERGVRSGRQVFPVAGGMAKCRR
jgi:hypothetical protein